MPEETQPPAPATPPPARPVDVQPPPPVSPVPAELKKSPVPEDVEMAYTYTVSFKKDGGIKSWRNVYSRTPGGLPASALPHIVFYLMKEVDRFLSIQASVEKPVPPLPAFAKETGPKEPVGPQVTQPPAPATPPPAAPPADAPNDGLPAFPDAPVSTSPAPGT